MGGEPKGPDPGHLLCVLVRTPEISSPETSKILQPIEEGSGVVPRRGIKILSKDETSAAKPSIRPTPPQSPTYTTCYEVRSLPLQD
eukprot:2518116-Pleurochrysis_carterae.AAC.3